MSASAVPETSSHTRSETYFKVFSLLGLYPGSWCWGNTELCGFSPTVQFVFKNSLKDSTRDTGQGSSFSSEQPKYKKFS